MVLDHGTHVFIWLGKSGGGVDGWTQELMEAAAQGFVEGLAQGRSPVPEVRTAVEVWHVFDQT